MTPKEHNGPARRVFVVDDHPLIRDGLAQLINAEPDLTVCGSASETQTALRMLDQLRPDVFIIDLSMEGPDGLELVKSIRLREPYLPLLVLSMHDENIYAERALRAGANGYIMKQEATERVLVAIRRILGGEIYVSDRMASRMLQQLVAGTPSPKISPLDSLSDRELEVFRRIGQGKSTRQIAEDLHLSVKTVESHQAHLKEKLSLRSARELVQYAIEWTVAEKGEYGGSGWKMPRPNP